MKLKLVCFAVLALTSLLSLPATAGEDIVFDENFVFDEPEIVASIENSEQKNDENTTENTPEQTYNVEEVSTKNTEQTPAQPLLSNKNPPFTNQNANMSVSTGQSFTDTLKANPQTNQTDETWLDRIVSSNPLSMIFPGDTENDADNNLKNLLRDTSKKNKFGKASVEIFDVSGIMLNMKVKDVDKAMRVNGFKKINARFQIPNFIKWRNEEACRNSGVVGYERLEACVAKKAQEKNHQYPEYIRYVKFDSKEEIEVFFTSNYTENSVYKVVYSSEIPNIAGNSAKALYIRNIKVFDFWKRINSKYGVPDNKTTVTWGSGGNSPFMKVSTGHITLEDPQLQQKDYNRMAEEDKKFVTGGFYNF